MAFGADRDGVVVNASQEPLQKQYDLSQEGVVLLPLGGRTIIDIRGTDRSKFLHNLCTNDVLRLTPGTGCEAFFCNVQGKVLGHVHLFCHDSFLRLETVDGQSEKLLSHLDKYLIQEDVELIDRSLEISQAIVVGRHRAEWPSEWHLHGGDYLEHHDCVIADVPVVVCQAAIAGPDSTLLQFPRSATSQLHARLEAEGAVDCSEELVSIFRTEANFPFYEVDITEQCLPQEVCRDEMAVSFTKGCYLGQETVARIDAVGRVNWHLVLIAIPISTPPNAGAPVTVEDKKTGAITSAVYSPKHSATIAFARLRREFSAVGQSVTVNGVTAHVMKA